MATKSKIVMLIEAKGASKAAAEIDKVDGKVKGLDRNAKNTDKTSKQVAGRFKNLGAAAKVGAVGVGALGLKLGKDALAEYREAYKVGKQTNAVIEATGGVAGVSADHVSKLTESISNKTAIDDEEIQKASNMLLTFKQIRNETGKNNDVFDRATKAAVDMSASGFGSMKSASVMLGKALNDPLKGMTALSRVGVSFTADQQKQVKALMETGDVLGAQKIIMAEVEGQVKGSAAAQADPIDRLRVTWANLLETVGTKFAPVVNKLVTFLAADLIPALMSTAGWINRNKNTLLPLGVALATLLGTYKLYVMVTNAAKAAQIGLNIAMTANPVGLVVAAIAALVIGLVVAYKRVAWFRNAVDAVFGFIKKNWKSILIALTGPLGLAYVLIKKYGGSIVGFAKSLPGRVTRALSGLWDGIKNTFKGAINWIIGKWNSFSLSIGPIKIPAAPDIPKVSVNTPNIPLLAAGGNAMGVGTRWISGEAGPELGEITSSGARITPLGSDTGSGAEAVIHLQVNLDGREVGRGVRRVALRDMLAASPA